MSNLEETKGIFLGKEWQSEGKRKDGTPFVRYKLAFRPNPQSEKSFHMTFFTPNKFPNGLKLEDLKDGVMYKILYNEQPYVNKQGIQATSRTVAGIFMPSAVQEQPKAEFQSASTIVSNTLSKPNLSNFEVFSNEYMKLVARNGIKPTAVHMLGSWIATNEKERVVELIEKCKEVCK